VDATTQFVHVLSYDVCCGHGVFPALTQLFDVGPQSGDLLADRRNLPYVRCVEHSGVVVARIFAENSEPSGDRPATGHFTGLLWQWLSVNSVHRQIAHADSNQ
jgi:hypothetical protein